MKIKIYPVMHRDLHRSWAVDAVLARACSDLTALDPSDFERVCNEFADWFDDGDCDIVLFLFYGLHYVTSVGSGLTRRADGSFEIVTVD